MRGSVPILRIGPIVLVALVALIGLQVQSAHTQSMAWSVFGSLKNDRIFHKAHYIGNGKILVVGGYTNTTGILQGKRTSACEIIDVRNGTIRGAAPLTRERGIVTSVVGPDGSLYVVGGDTDNGSTDLVERYDANDNVWEIVGRLRVPRWQHACAFISETEMLVVAGWNENSAEIFDVRTGASRLITEFPWIANSLVPVLLQNHRPAFVGGRSGGPNTGNTTTAFSYDPAKNRWVTVCEMPELTVRPTVLNLKSGHSLIVGGTRSETPYVAGPGIDYMKDGYDVTRLGTLSQGRQWHSMVQRRNGQVLVAGGYVDGPVVAATTEWLDPVTGVVQPGPTMNAPRTQADMVIFQDRGAEYIVAVSGMTSITSGSANGTPLVEILVDSCAQGIMPLASGMSRVAGSAHPRDTTLELTDAVPFSRGAVWSTSKVNMQQRFTMLLGFLMRDGVDNGDREEIPSDPGADGIAIVIQNEGLDAIGQYGRGIGYDGIKRSLAIEFDTYQNIPVNDPNGNHLGIQSMGYLPNSSRHAPPANLAFTSSIPRMRADGTTYYALVEYVNKELRVYFNDKPSFGRPSLVRILDLDSLIGLDERGAAWVGVTSSTGESVERHEIVLWEINGCDSDAMVSVSEDRSAPIGETLSFEIDGSRIINLSGNRAFVAVYDSQGRQILRYDTDEARIDMSSWNLTNGCYIIRVSSGDAVQSFPMLLVR